MTELVEAPLPPQNIASEEWVLAAMLVSPHAIDQVADLLDPTDFYLDTHRHIYRAALSLHKLGRPVDGILVGERLEELGQFDATASERLLELARTSVPAANARAHAEVIVTEARRRRYAHLGEQLQRRSYDSAGIDELRRLAADVLEADGRRTTNAQPPKIATLDQFVQTQEEHAEPLAGDIDETLLPAGGLLIVGGEGGASKTTLTLDAIAHLASGTTWLGYPAGRPVRILIIENEGPRPKFREKLADKVATWRGLPFAENVHVWEEPWAQFSFGNDTHRRQLRDVAADHSIDLVVADPLDSLGIVGAGTPEDVRLFIGWLKECGLHNPQTPLAFWILHHFNKSGQRSVVAQLSGAWGGHPDAVIGLELGDGQTTKLTWGKLRHATPPADKTTVLVWDLDTRGFHPIDKIAKADSDTVTTAIIKHVALHPGLAHSIAVDGIHAALKEHGASRNQIRRTIDRLTETDPPTLAVRPGAAPNGRYLYPASDLSLPLADTLFGEHGKQTFPLQTDPACRSAAASNGEHGEQTAAPTQTEVLAGWEEGPPKGGPSKPRATGDGSARRQLAETYIDTHGWMLEPDALMTELLTRYPTLGPHDHTHLLARAAAAVADAAGTEPEPPDEKKKPEDT